MQHCMLSVQHCQWTVPSRHLPGALTCHHVAPAAKPRLPGSMACSWQYISDALDAPQVAPGCAPYPVSKSSCRYHQPPNRQQPTVARNTSGWPAMAGQRLVHTLLNQQGVLWWGAVGWHNSRHVRGQSEQVDPAAVRPFQPEITPTCG